MFLRMMPIRVGRNVAAAPGYNVAQGGHHGHLFDPSTVAANSSYHWTHKHFMSGVCSCRKYMPLPLLGAGGLLGEWELGNATHGISNAVTSSTSWHISDVRAQASVINLNTQLQEAYSAHMMSGEFLMIP